ncbi:RNA polymerase factor sigma-32 [soil metagenome]
MGSLFDTPSLQAYRSKLSQVKQLDRDTERELAKRYLAGDRRAGDKLIEACLPFVVAIALEYRRWGIPIEDIIQQGNVGLLRAAAKFDPKRECRLATYAAYWIRAEIREYVVRGYRVVRLGTTKAERRALRAYRTTKESDPERLAKVSGLSPERAAGLLPILAAREASIDLSRDDGPSIADRLAATGPSPEELTAQRELDSRSSAEVRIALADLTDREKLIVRERLMAEEPRTLQELGTILGVSKERVRQIEERTRNKLRVKLERLSPLVAA